MDRTIFINHNIIIACFLIFTSFFVYADDQNINDEKNIDNIEQDRLGSNAISDAKYAILMDADSNYVMFEKNADTPTPPSSMTKLMSLYIIFCKIKTGDLAMEDVVTVSTWAYQAEGTRMFLEIGDKVSVKDLIMGMIVQSGNDATIALSEHIAGNESNFVSLMNDEAKKMGLSHTEFANSTGLPNPKQKMSCRDLAILSKNIIKHHPDLYHLFSQKEFSYAGISQYSKNTALGQIGIDGLKTGYTDAGGYGIAMSAKTDDNRRIIAVVNGMPTEIARVQTAKNLIAYAAKNFYNIKLSDHAKPIIQVDVFHGSQNTVGLVSKDDLWVTLPNGVKKEELKVLLDFQNELIAPVFNSANVATLKVGLANGSVVLEAPLYPQQDVLEAGIIKKSYQNLIKKVF